MAKMTEEEKENKKRSVRVNSCCSCIHPSKPATSQFYGAARSLVTSRHPGLHVIPYAANFMGTYYVILHCTVLYRVCCTVRMYRGTRADACCPIPILEENPQSASPLLSPLPGLQRIMDVNCINPTKFCPQLGLSVIINPECQNKMFVIHPSNAPFESASSSFICHKRNYKKARPAMHTGTLQHHETSPTCTATCRLKSARWLRLQSFVV
jgi:hypothetical protein